MSNTMFFVESKEDADKLQKMGYQLINCSNGIYTFLNNGSMNFGNINVTFTNNLCF